MPTPPQTTAHTTHVPSGLGIDEGTRPELVPFGTKNLAVTNCRQNQLGDLDPRYGFSTLGNAHIDATTPAVGYKLLADTKAPVRICDGQIEAYSSRAQAWQTLGRVPECGVGLVSAPSLGAAGSISDVDATNGYVALAWSSVDASASITTYVAIIDQSTGAVVRAPEALGAGTTTSELPLCIIGNSFVAVRYSAAGTKLEAWSLDTTSPATLAVGWVPYAASIATDCAGGFVVHSMPTRSQVAIAYNNTLGGAAQISVKTISATAVVASTTITTGAAGSIGIGGLDTDTLWVAWGNGALVKVCGLNPANIAGAPLASTLLLTTLGAPPDDVYVAGSTVAGKARVWFSVQGSSNAGFMRGIQTTAGAAASDGSGSFAPNTRMVRKPFFRSGIYYSAFYAGDDLGGTINAQQNFIICDWTADTHYVRPVANIAPGLASAGSYGSLGKFAAGAAGTICVGLGIKKSGVASGSQIAVLDFASTARWQACAWSGSVYLAGGLLSCFDGLRVAEAGLLIRPPTPTTSVGGAGITGSYRYVAVYEEVDADGNWHQSGLSSPSATVSPAGQTVTVVTAPLAITTRQSSTVSGRALRVVFYRTLTGAVAPYYRLAIVLNDPSSTTMTFADTTTDAVLAANAKLYSQPGVIGTSQDKRPPPFFSCITAYNGSLVGASGSDVWYSGQNVSGEGVWFNPIFQIPVPGDGDITALWVMDGTLFVAKRREIYAIAGEAPSDNGASGGLGLPRRLAVDVGCIEPRSACVTSLGTFFQSDRGIEILTRAQTVAWIGQPIQNTLAAFPIVTSATVEPVACVVYIELALAQSAGVVSGNGRTLVFDLSIKDWVSVDTRTALGGTPYAPSQSAAMIYTGNAYRYAWLTAAGVVHYEDPTTFLDPGNTFVGAAYETGWLKHGLQQEQRVWSGTLLFERHTAAGLIIECAYDYGPYVGADLKQWTEAETLGRRQLEWRPKPRGEAMKFRVTATAPAVLGTGQAFTFIGMSFDLAPKQGATKGVVRLDPTVRK